MDAEKNERVDINRKGHMYRPARSLTLVNSECMGNSTIVSDERSTSERRDRD